MPEPDFLPGASVDDENPFPVRPVDDPSSPARLARAVVPHDANELPDGLTKALFVGTGGNVSCRPVDSAQDVVFKNVPDGTTLAVRVTHVRASGTTAADIVALS